MNASHLTRRENDGMIEIIQILTFIFVLITVMALSMHRSKTEILQTPSENLVVMCKLCLKTAPYIPGAQAKHTCKEMTWDFESVRPGVTEKEGE